MNNLKCLLPKLLLLSCMLVKNEGFTVPKNNFKHQRTALASTYTAEKWYPQASKDVFPVPNSKYSDQVGELDLFDTVASMFASWILDVIKPVPFEQTQQSSEGKAEKETLQTQKLYHLSRDKLASILLQDVHQRNSLVTADFTRSIYEDTCRFQDGSGLDGAYPMKPWILGCKLLFKGNKSKATIIEESLIVTSDQISFRFESDLEFRGPLSPQVALTGRIVMTRNPLTGLISSYRESWDQEVFDIVREAKLQM